MATFTNINVGTAPNDGTGSSLREAFRITNNNFVLLSNVFPDATNVNVNVTSTSTSTFNYLEANVISVQTLGNAGTLITGNIVTAAQPNITSIGNLTSLTVAGNLDVTSGTSTFDSDVQVNGEITLVGNLNAANVTITAAEYLQFSNLVSNTWAVTDTDRFLYVNVAVVGNTAISMPNATSSSYRLLEIYRFDPGNTTPNSNVTLTTQTGGGDIYFNTSFGSNSVVLSRGAPYIRVISDGRNWIKLNGL